MNTIVFLVILTFVSGVVGTGFGGFLGTFIQKSSEKALSFLLAFASGVSLAVVFFDLIPESFAPENATEDMPVWLVVVGLAVGFFVVYLMNDIIEGRIGHKHNHSEELECGHDHSHHKEHHSLISAGVIMACAIGLHNLPAGMIIGASYAGHSGSLFNNGGFILAMVILLHNIPEGMTVSVPLSGGKVKRGRAVSISAISGFPIIIGAVIGYYVGLINPIMLSLSLSFAAGAMLYVVFTELIPEVFSLYKSKLPSIFLLIGAILGLVLVNLE